MGLTIFHKIVAIFRLNMGNISWNIVSPVEPSYGCEYCYDLAYFGVCLGWWYACLTHHSSLATWAPF